MDKEIKEVKEVKIDREQKVSSNVFSVEELEIMFVGIGYLPTKNLNDPNIPKFVGLQKKIKGLLTPIDTSDSLQSK